MQQKLDSTGYSAFTFANETNAADTHTPRQTDAELHNTLSAR